MASLLRTTFIKKFLNSSNSLYINLVYQKVLSKGFSPRCRRFNPLLTQISGSKHRVLTQVSRVQSRLADVKVFIIEFSTRCRGLDYLLVKFSIIILQYFSITTVVVIEIQTCSSYLQPQNVCLT